MLNAEELTSKAAFRALETYGILAIEVILAILIGFGLATIGLDGAAWILGGMVGGAMVFSLHRAFNQNPIQPNRQARKVGQLLVGLTIGLSLQHNNLHVLSSQLLIFLGLPVFLMLSGAAIGLIYAQIEKTDRLTGLLATTPGNIGVMASIAADYSKNTALVSIVQLMRFTTVILVIPLIANVAIAQTHTDTIAQIIRKIVIVSWQDLRLSVLVIAITLFAVYCGGKLKIPMAAFLCAIAVGLLLDIVPFTIPAFAQLDFQLPFSFNLIGQILLGVTIGEYWGINPKLSIATVIRTFIPVTLTLIAAFLAALLIQHLTGWDWLTCLLVTAPGGSPEMLWIALTLHQDPDIVTTAHVIRLLTINVSLPLFLTFASTINAEADSAN